MLQQGIPSIPQTNVDMITCNEEFRQCSKNGLRFKVFGSNFSLQAGEMLLFFSLPLSKNRIRIFSFLPLHNKNYFQINYFLSMDWYRK